MEIIEERYFVLKVSPYELEAIRLGLDSLTLSDAAASGVDYDIVVDLANSIERVQR